MKKLFKEAKIRVQYILELGGKWDTHYIVEVIFIHEGITHTIYLKENDINSCDKALDAVMTEFTIPILKNIFDEKRNDQ